MAGTVRQFMAAQFTAPLPGYPSGPAPAGAFLISAFHNRFEREKMRAWNDRIPVYGHYPLKVSHGAKKKILKELRFFNVTRETIYPGLEESASAVNALAEERMRRR